MDLSLNGKRLQTFQRTDWRLNEKTSFLTHCVWQAANESIAYNLDSLTSEENNKDYYKK